MLLLPFANRGGRLDAAHLGHLQIHQHQIEGLSLDCSNRLMSVGGDDDLAGLEKARRRHELETAAVIQSHLYPQVFPDAGEDRGQIVGPH